MDDHRSSEEARAAASGAGTATFAYYGSDWELVEEDCAPNYYPPSTTALPAPGQQGDKICVECIPDVKRSRRKAEEGRGGPATEAVASRTDYAAVTRLNLLYHVYPCPANDVWLRNVRQLRRRLGIFNGRKLVAIAVGPGLVAPDVVKAALDWPDVEYLPVPNDRETGHVASFSKLLDAVRSKDPGEASFYAHTKGAANGHQDPKAIEYWRNAMYASLLDAPDQVCNALRHFAAVGACKMVYPSSMAFPSGLRWGRWHFSGTFFWFRHDRIFRDFHWPFVPHDYFGAEAWLGGFLEPDEAISFLQPAREDLPTWSAYDRHLWSNPIADPELAAGNGKSAADRRISVVIPCKGRLGHLRRTLPHWLKQERPPHEIIVVDYGCPEQCGDWVNRTHPSVRVVRAVNGTAGYNGSRARNLGAVEASGEYLAFVDADFIAPPDYLDRVRRVIERGHDLVCIAHYDNGELGLNGVCTVSAALFQRIRGYDESHPTYGFEDTDFYRRCLDAGALMGYLHNCQCISHSDEMRMQFFPHHDKVQAMQASAEWMTNTGRPVNPAGFGRP